MSEVRLIDANALKEALRSNCKPELCHDINTAWCESCCRTNDFEDLIDNAPTVEYPFYQEAYQTGYEEGYNAKYERPQGDLIKAFELLKAHCKNRECNKDCVFYRELRAGNDIEQFCGLCEIVMSDDKGNDNDK